MAKPFHVPKGTFHSVSLQNKLTAKLQFDSPIVSMSHLWYTTTNAKDSEGEREK